MGRESTPLMQGSAQEALWAKSGPLLVFNKVLLECRHRPIDLSTIYGYQTELTALTETM